MAGWSEVGADGVDWIASPANPQHIRMARGDGVMRAMGSSLVNCIQTSDAETVAVALEI